MSNFYRSKDEYVALAEKAINTYGEKAILDIVKIDQFDDDTLMFSMPINTSLCHLLLQRLPRDYFNPEGIQRAYKAAKINEIADLLKNDPNYTAPGAIVATLERKNREWFQIEWDK